MTRALLLLCAYVLGGCMITPPSNTESGEAMAEPRFNAVGQNCDLSKRPDNAVAGKFFASDAYMFPAAPGPNYSGCLWLWIVNPGDYVYLETVSVYKNGEPIGYRSKEQRSTGRFVVKECTYESGRIVTQTVHPAEARGSYPCMDAVQLRAALGAGLPSEAK